MSCFGCIWDGSQGSDNSDCWKCDNCSLYEEDEEFTEIKKQIRANALDELVKEAKKQYTVGEITYYDGTTDTVRYVALALLEQIAENLKENKDEWNIRK